MTVKLTYAEYKKASDAGLITGHACACVGPQDDDEWCPCSMNILEKIVPEDQHLLTEEWESNGYLSRTKQNAKLDAKYAEMMKRIEKHLAEAPIREKAGWAQMEKFSK